MDSQLSSSPVICVNKLILSAERQLLEAHLRPFVRVLCQLSSSDGILLHLILLGSLEVCSAEFSAKDDLKAEMPTQKINVSSLDSGIDPFAPQYGQFFAGSDDSMTSVRDVEAGFISSTKGITSCGQKENGNDQGNPSEIRFTKKHAELAARAAKTWSQHAETWSEFTKHTTFHGIKYIFDSSYPHKWRR